MFIPEHVFLVEAPCSRALCWFIFPIQVFSAGLMFETSDFEITASLSNLAIAESTGFYIHSSSGVFICARSPNASWGIFSHCYALYQHKGIKVSFGKPALLCLQIFSSLVFLCPSPILSLSVFPSLWWLQTAVEFLSDLCSNSLK